MRPALFPVLLGLMLPGAALAQDCPVSFSAHHYGLTAALRPTGSNESPRPTHTLQLAFDPTSGARIASLTIVVHGRSGHAGALLLRQAQKTESASQTLELRADGGRFDPVQFLVIDSVPLTTRVEVTEIHYRDGTSWRAPAANACSVVPSAFVLVDATASR